jgi:hypothetical protein
VTRREIELLSEGIIPGRVESSSVQFNLKAGERIFVGMPAHPPSSTIQGILKSKAGSLSSVAELYLFQMATQTSSHTVIGIVLSEDLTDRDKEDIVKNMQISVQPELKPNESLDFTFLHGSNLDQVKKLGGLIFHRP